MNKSVAVTLDEFFAGELLSRKIFSAVQASIDKCGPVSRRVTKSQISFRRKRAFAWAWIPGRYLKGNTAPLVLSISLTRRDRSPRWKEIVEPSDGHFMHHLELFKRSDVDESVVKWLREAWDTSG